MTLQLDPARVRLARDGGGLDAATVSSLGPERLDAATVSGFGPERLDVLMGADASRDIGYLSDWLLRQARTAHLPIELIVQLCEKLNSLGMPLDRFVSSTQTLDAEHDAIGRSWVRGNGVTEQVYIRASEDDPRYLDSPFYASATSGKWIELWVPSTDDGLFSVVPDLKDAGIVHYLCVPLFLMSGANAWLTFGTRAASGFSVVHLAMIARLMPTLGVLIDMRSTWIALDKLLRTYVGDEPHQAILRGNTKRGQISIIRSAMLFADMRDSIGHTVDLDVVSAAAVFNTLFDCLVPSIESRQGQVLKYIGDGLLAIFREGKDASCDAAVRALAAAEDALQVLQARNLAHPDERPIHVGIALHYGEAAYGNVGSGVRLDFTVIGKDVGLASRIAGMNRTLDEPLLMSAPFVERLNRPAIRLGAYAARGFKEPVEVFRPGEP